MNEIFRNMDEKDWQKWLSEQYRSTLPDRLAKALTRLRWSQFPQIVNRFLSPELDSRVAAALLEMNTAEPKHLLGIVQFLGAVELIGRPICHEGFGVDVSQRIEGLPNLVSSRGDAIGHEEKMLWLGLRAVTILMPSKTLRLASDRIRDTLGRWRVALKQSDQKPEDYKRLDKTMIVWLEDGLAADGCLPAERGI